MGLIPNLASVRKFGDTQAYQQHVRLCRMLRLSGSPKARITHVVQVERIHNTIEGDLMQVPLGTVWALTERHVTDDDRVGRLTRVIHSDMLATHFELHLAARSWMWGQSYVTDFGPNHCDEPRQCQMSSQDDEWLNTQYLPEWQRRLGPVILT